MPIIPLVLLALILGLPAILIVITAHRWSYVLWMAIYLLSLPIWNLILPAYAFWKFDDFSWGDTRKLAGQKTKKAGIEYEGEFDSSKITMKKWREFEQERRSYDGHPAAAAALAGNGGAGASLAAARGPYDQASASSQRTSTAFGDLERPGMGKGMGNGTFYPGGHDDYDRYSESEH